MATEILVALISGGTALVTTILGPIIIEKFKNKKDLLKETIEINTLVDNKLEELKKIYEADRVWLCQFHNGGHFYPTGKSIQKFSMIYEIPSNSSPIQHTFQNVPTGLFSKSINHLASGDIITISDYKKDDNFGLESLYDNDARSSYVFPILTLNNKFIGFVGLDYTKKTVLDQEKIDTLEFEINSIGGVLMNEYLDKK